MVSAQNEPPGRPLPAHPAQAPRPPRPPLTKRLRPGHWVAIDFAVGTVAALFGLLVTVTGAEGMVFHHGLLFRALLLVATFFSVGLRRRGPLVAFGVLLAVTAATVETGGPASILVLMPSAYVLYLVTVTGTKETGLTALGTSLGLIAALMLVTRSPSPFPPSEGILVGLALVIAWITGYSVRQRRAYAAMLQEQAASNAVAEERLRIARELHDIVAHSMSVIAVQAGYGQYVIDSRPGEARNALGAIQATSRDALEELRRMLGVLRQRDGAAVSPGRAAAAGPAVPARVRAPDVARVTEGADTTGDAVADVTVAAYVSGGVNGAGVSSDRAAGTDRAGGVAGADRAAKADGAAGADGVAGVEVVARADVIAVIEGAGVTAGGVVIGTDRAAGADRAAVTDGAAVAGVSVVASGSDYAGTGAAPLAPAPGLADLDRLVRRTSGAGVQVSVRSLGRQGDLPAGVDLSAYRIVQEALTNVVKHAGGGSRCTVTVDHRADGLGIEVTDDGGRGPVFTGAGLPGIAGAPGRAFAAAAGTGHGIIGMRERVNLCGGEFSAGPLPGGGFRVAARLPLGDGIPRGGDGDTRGKNTTGAGV
ncbi:MAG: hypothetical protein JOY82_25850 [Streptosporangiaceae bacterium]|nr:hypothetical protein [Streptosporangiaceae bacterium]